MLAFTWAAPPAGAAEVKTVPAGQTPISTSVAARLAARPLPRALQTPAPPASSDPGGSFLRSRTGVVAMVVMAAGLGFAIRSAFKDNDAVHSPVR
jgi:hypothetical protein